MGLIQSCFSKQDVPYKSLAHTHEEVFSSYQRKLVFFLGGGVQKLPKVNLQNAFFIFLVFMEAEYNNFFKFSRHSENQKS